LDFDEMTFRSRGFPRRFFPADIEEVLCGFYGLRALNPARA
jgi:hypothetical protein